MDYIFQNLLVCKALLRVEIFDAMGPIGFEFNISRQCPFVLSDRIEGGRSQILVLYFSLNFVSLKRYVCY